MPPLELIVADDGSTDETLAIVTAFADRVSFPVRIARNPQKLGYGENFLRAARAAAGDYIAFCDQDDVWLPEKLACCVAALERTGADLCAHAASLIDERGEPIGSFAQGIARDRVYEPLSLPPWEIFFGMSQVVRRDLLNHIDIASRGVDSHAPSMAVAHDRWVYFLATSLGRTAVLARPLVLYRQHDSNTFGGRRKTFMVRARGKLAGSADTLALYRSVAEHRAALLRSLAERSVGSALGDRAARASVQWAYVANIFHRRHRAYTSDRLSRRLVTWLDLARRRVYDAALERGHFGRSVLLKDLCLGVFGLRSDGPARPRDPPARQSTVGGGR